MPLKSGIIPVMGAGFAGGWRSSVGGFGMGAEGSAGRTVINPAGSVSGQQLANPYRTQLFGRLGPTSSHTAILHPEYGKSFNNQEGRYRAFQNPYVRTTDIRKEPAFGTAEGGRYWRTLRKEVMAAQNVYDPLSGKYGNRNLFRGNFNALLKGRAMGSQRPEFTGYDPNEAWASRLTKGISKERETQQDVGPTVQTYEGTTKL